MNYNPLVSVVIPVYKVEKYLKNSVLSVIGQTYKNIEIILVDDGSPDQCPKICDDLASKYKNISVVHKLNGGLSEARNFGIEHANGEYLLFLDSDDTLINNAIEELVKNALNSDADIVIPSKYIQVKEDTNNISERLHFDKSCFIEKPVSFVIEVMIGKGRAWRASALLYKASLIKNNKIEFPVGYVAEDICFNLRFMEKAKKIAFYEKPTINYLKRSGSITATFQEDLCKAFLCIDEKISTFLKETNQYNEYGNNKRKKLLCRNAIIYITDIFSKKCNWNRNQRIMKAECFLNNEQIKDAFSIKNRNINPYFDQKLIVSYFKIMFKLIKSGNRKIAYRLAELSGRIR